MTHRRPDRAAVEQRDRVRASEPVRLRQPLLYEEEDYRDHGADWEGAEEGGVLAAGAEDFAGAHASEQDGGGEVRVDTGAGEPAFLAPI